MHNNETIDDLRDVLIRAGFVRCDIAACNCGSWHHRYGYPERFRDFENALSDADHPPCNANGNSVFRALTELIAERDTLQSENERLRVALDSVRQKCCDRESNRYEVEMIATEALKEPK